jgi:IrrE N-terminal-like domain
VRRLAFVAGLIAALAPAGCVSLTPAQERAVAEVRAMADDTARVYGVSRIAVLVGSNVEGVGGTYRRGMFTLSTPMLRSRHRDSVVAHELAHYLLDHDRPLSSTLALDAQREQELRELDANAKAVEILVRVRRLREEQALSLVYDHLLAFDRLMADKRTVIPWGHRPPCDEIRDLLQRFPAQRGWTNGLPCGSAAPTPVAAVRAPTVITTSHESASGLIAQSYFTDRAPAPDVSDPATMPRALGSFDRGRDTQVTLLLGVRPQERSVRVVSRWYDESGVERRVVSRALDASTETAEASSWHTHTVPMWELRPYPGRWTAKVWVDEVAAGEYSFSLAR